MNLLLTSRRALLGDEDMGACYKIDNRATDGLLGVYNSLAYRVHEIETHLHSRELWYGRHSAVNPGVNEGEQGSILVFQSTSGAASAFGAWIPLLGTGDTPFKAGFLYFDPHRIVIADVAAGASADPHWIQLAWDDTAAADGFADGNFTELVTQPLKDGRAHPVEFRCPRIAAGLKLWLRHRVVGENASTMDFYLGLHEYIG